MAKAYLFFAMLLTTFFSPAFGSTVYPEIYPEIGGRDFSDNQGAAFSLGVLKPGVYNLIGFFDAGEFGDPEDGADESDAFDFITAGRVSIDLLSLSGDTPFLALFDKDDGSLRFLPPLIGPGERRTVGAGFFGMDLLGRGNGGAGKYKVTLTVDPSVVPLPSSALLLLGALGTAVFVTRRQ